MILGEDKWLLFTGRHFWNRKCRKKTWWQQEFAVFKCEATANSITGHVCVNSNHFFSHSQNFISCFPCPAARTPLHSLLPR